MQITPWPALAVVAIVAACATIPDEERALLRGPVECQRAETDLGALEAAKPDDMRKAGVLASSLGAGGLAVMVARNDVEDRRRVLSGRYERQIDGRMDQIRETCDIPDPAETVTELPPPLPS